MELRKMWVCLVLLFFHAQAQVHGRPLTEEGSSANQEPMKEGEAAYQNLELEKYLSSVNRPFVESHVLSDGSTVDCVRIEDQLTMQHPLMKNHTILTQPPFRVASRSAPYKAPKWQTFQVEKASCPLGTIPVLRVMRQHVQSFGSPDLSHRKYPPSSFVQSPLDSLFNKNAKLEPASVFSSHQYAIVQASGTFSGAMSYMSIWAPYVASDLDFSLSQMWVGAGTGSSINTVEVGWQVYPLLTGDYKPHLFIYWTSDAYLRTGCYNLRCPAFVQIDGIWVGYWPAFLFGNLQRSAQWIQWGGEVCLTAPNSGTDMGSGFFPSAGTTRAASHNGISSVDGALNRQDANNLVPFTSDASRYATQVQYKTDQGTNLLYGGPGL